MMGQNLEDIERWLQDVEKEIKELSTRIAPLQKQLEAALERRDLTKRLLHLTKRELGVAFEETKFSQNKKTELTGAISVLREQKEKSMENFVDEMLHHAGAPMHIKAIRDGLIEKGVSLPGRGDEANVILRLRRCPERFVRTGRGMYGLATWGLPEVKAIKKKIIKKRSRMWRAA